MFKQKFNSTDQSERTFLRLATMLMLLVLFLVAGFVTTTPAAAGERKTVVAETLYVRDS